MVWGAIVSGIDSLIFLSSVLLLVYNEAEERISDIEDQMMENKEAEKKRDKQLLDHEGRIREISDTIRQNNIRIIGISEEEERGGKKYTQALVWCSRAQRI